jgi:2-polyprenyl-3-methyl-5-hydroxy-6-metoxy-1,4-benzoquinol methylase
VPENDSDNLLKQESHFAFGKNWASYAEGVSEEKIRSAMEWLSRLLGGDLEGKRFVDIGCGSGVHSLAALRLGAREVVGIDIDPDSVATARKVLQAHAPGGPWSVHERSVFDLPLAGLGTFDVVYSWGVLHHTGNMYRAIQCASELVAPRGVFVFALYRATRLCWFWKMEKRWYAKASAAAQKRAQAVYVRWFRLLSYLTGGDADAYISGYSSMRGMDFHHDVHDWLGGWPYESITPEQTVQTLAALGFSEVRRFCYPRTPMGYLGSVCDEYAYRRN